jgi:transcriptional regulator with XRE-family HTH domain
MEAGIQILQWLEERRRELGLSSALLSKRSGVSRATVQRVLSGRDPAAGFGNILAIAEAMGLGLRLYTAVDVRDLKREQAERKARRLVAVVQGTSGLEGQAVDAKALESMVEQTTHELLAGSKRKLWSEE